MNGPHQNDSCSRGALVFLSKANTLGVTNLINVGIFSMLRPRRGSEKIEIHRNGLCHVYPPLKQRAPPPHDGYARAEGAINTALRKSSFLDFPRAVVPHLPTDLSPQDL